MISHPEPAAKLAYLMFNSIQSYLREILYWGDPRDSIVVAAVGGIAVHSASGSSFVPLNFEVLDLEGEALHDLLQETFPECPDTGTKLLFPTDTGPPK